MTIINVNPLLRLSTVDFKRRARISPTEDALTRRLSQAEPDDASEDREVAQQYVSEHSENWDD